MPDSFQQVSSFKLISIILVRRDLNEPIYNTSYPTVTNQCQYRYRYKSIIPRAGRQRFECCHRPVIAVLDQFYRCNQTLVSVRRIQFSDRCRFASDFEKTVDCIDSVACIRGCVTNYSVEVSTDLCHKFVAVIWQQRERIDSRADLFKPWKQVFIYSSAEVIDQCIYP